MKTKPIKIFIVEDNDVFAMTLKADIENHYSNVPLEIQLFKTGEESWTKYKGEKPQVVILDYNLNSKTPDAMDGNEVLVWFIRENPKAKIILLTSEDNIEIAIESFRIGAFDYVVKNETQFKRIHYSLFNIFNLLKAEKESNSYRNIVIAMVLCFTLLIGGVAALKFSPYLFN